MATSPLTAALKPNVSAGDEADQKYQQALNELMQRLDTRKNRLFDPTLLAMAQGFLTPGQTGSFGEALGNVAQRVGTVQQQQQKEDIDLAQMRLQVAQGAREQAARLKGQEAFRGILGGGQRPPAPAQGDEFTGETGTGLRTVPGDAENVLPPPASGQSPAGSQRNITERDALAFASAYPDQKELAKLLMDAAKFNADRYKVAMNGTVFDTVEGKYIAAIPPGQTASNYFIPEARGTVLMTPSQHADYQKARSEGNAKQWLDSFYGGEPGKPVEYVTQEMLSAEAERRKQTASDFLIPQVDDYVKMTPGQYEDYLKANKAGEGVKWLEKFFGRPVSGGAAAPTSGATPGAGAAPSAAPGAGAATGAAPVAARRIPTSAQIEADAAAKRTEAESVAKADADRYNTAISRGSDAGGRIANYRVLAATAQQPGADKIMGVFEQGGFGDAVLQYLEANNGIISAKDIRNIWTNLKLDPKLIADKQVVLSLIAQTTQEFRKATRIPGEGAISDLETNLFRAMGPDISDRPEALYTKMKMLERRAEWEREVAKFARNARKQSLSFEDMKETEGYVTAWNTYIKDLTKLVVSQGKSIPSSAPSAPRAATGATPGAPAPLPRVTNPAAARLRRDLGIAQ